MSATFGLDVVWSAEGVVETTAETCLTIWKDVYEHTALTTQYIIKIHMEWKGYDWLIVRMYQMSNLPDAGYWLDSVYLKFIVEFMSNKSVESSTL